VYVLRVLEDDHQVSRSMKREDESKTMVPRQLSLPGRRRLSALESSSSLETA
jgi:hypothetical protein